MSIMCFVKEELRNTPLKSMHIYTLHSGLGHVVYLPRKAFPSYTSIYSFNRFVLIKTESTISPCPTSPPLWILHIMCPLTVQVNIYSQEGKEQQGKENGEIMSPSGTINTDGKTLYVKQLRGHWGIFLPSSAHLFPVGSLFRNNSHHLDLQKKANSSSAIAILKSLFISTAHHNKTIPFIFFSQVLLFCLKCSSAPFLLHPPTLLHYKAKSWCSSYSGEVLTKASRAFCWSNLRCLALVPLIANLLQL